jgi:hypothetical protein
VADRAVAGGESLRGTEESRVERRSVRGPRPRETCCTNIATTHGGCTFSVRGQGLLFGEEASAVTGRGLGTLERLSSTPPLLHLIPPRHHCPSMLLLSPGCVQAQRGPARAMRGSRI